MSDRRTSSVRLLLAFGPAKRGKRRSPRGPVVVEGARVFLNLTEEGVVTTRQAQPPRASGEEREVECAVCGLPFYAPPGNHCYCGHECREEGHRRKQREWHADDRLARDLLERRGTRRRSA